MKKAIAILILAALLSGCAHSAEPSAEVVTTTATSSSAITMTEKEKPFESVTMSESKTTTTHRTTTQTPTVTTTTTSATTAHTAPTSATERTSRETTQATKKQPVSARCEPVRATTAMTTSMQTQSAATTTTRTTTTAKPGTTTQPAVTTTTKITVPKPPIISKATTTVIENGITYVEVPDITCLATMIENLEGTDTPLTYYIQVGHSLKHDGTDYGKAVAVFRWMEQNGWGSCVYHSLEAYYVCQGIGLECAYALCTDNGWYGHTITVVKVEGEWYALDTQAGIFLDNWHYLCKRMFDGMDRDLPPFDEDAFYPYDEDGEYRNWTIEYID